MSQYYVTETLQHYFLGFAIHEPYLLFWMVSCLSIKTYKITCMYVYMCVCIYSYKQVCTYVCVWGRGRDYVSRQMCGGQRTTYWSRSFPSTMWILGIKLKPLEFTGGNFPCCAILEFLVAFCHDNFFIDFSLLLIFVWLFFSW